MKWRKGQRWRDRFGNIHHVVRVDRGGVAWIVMAGCKKELSQRPIPPHWTLVGEKDNK